MDRQRLAVLGGGAIGGLAGILFHRSSMGTDALCGSAIGACFSWGLFGLVMGEFTWSVNTAYRPTTYTGIPARLFGCVLIVAAVVILVDMPRH